MFRNPAATLRRHSFRLIAFALCLSAATGSAWASTFDSEPASPQAVSLPPNAPAAPRLRMSAPPPGPPLRPANEAWVEATLAPMSLDEKIGQLIMPQWTAQAAQQLRDYRVGGFIFLATASPTILNATNSLQGQTTVPLIFSIDCEAGSGARITDGTRFPMNMGLAATRRTDLATLEGRVTARECRAAGVQMGFGPVADVNTEPVNPIIGIRAYSDNPDLVAQMAQAYIDGAHAEGLLCTLKHYPGHGAANGDSHSSLPVVDVTRAQLEAVHLKPYRTLVNAGFADLVMSAHVWYPALDPGPNAWPATLSSVALTDILRTEVGFQGTVISDAFGMAGLQQAATTYDAVRIGVLAGLDIILMPPSVDDAARGLRDAVTSGLITTARIDEGVRRILRLKSRVGMPEHTTNSAETLAATIRHPDHLAAAREIGIGTVAAGAVRAGDLPLTASQKILCLTLSGSGQIFYLYDSTSFTQPLAARLPLLDVRQVSTTISSSAAAAIVADSAAYDRVVVASYNWKPRDTTAQESLVQALQAAGRRVVYVSFGSPYREHWYPPGLGTFLCAFSSHYDSQDAAAQVLPRATAPPAPNGPSTATPRPAVSGDGGATEGLAPFAAPIAPDSDLLRAAIARSFHGQPRLPIVFPERPAPDRGPTSLDCGSHAPALAKPACWRHKLRIPKRKHGLRSPKENHWLARLALSLSPICPLETVASRGHDGFMMRRFLFALFLALVGTCPLAAQPGLHGGLDRLWNAPAPGTRSARVSRVVSPESFPRPQPTVAETPTPDR